MFTSYVVVIDRELTANGLLRVRNGKKTFHEKRDYRKSSDKPRVSNMYFNVVW